MRKNIAIFGASRSGKSTLARMIAGKWKHYHVIGGDEVRDAFIGTVPESEINNHGGNGMRGKFQQYLQKLFHLHISKNRGDIWYVVETCDMSPKMAKELFARNDTIILFLGYPNQTQKKHFEEIRAYETERDWTWYASDNKVRNHARDGVKFSRRCCEECEELGIWFIDTSENRDEVLNETLNELARKMRGRAPKSAK